MAEKKPVLGIVGSPNPEGRTNRLVTAALEGARQKGAETELVQLSEYQVEACKDCLPWVCHTNLKCTYKDESFDFLCQRLLNCGALVLGAPVYWWDVSGLIKYLILKMFRVYARSAPLAGLPAFGLAIAGGTGNGLISGLRPLYHFFQMMQMHALPPLPATRFDFDQALSQAKAQGGRLAKMADARIPFEGLEERLKHYDELPYLGMSRAAERRLLASLACEALPAGSAPSQLLARAEAAGAAGDALRAQKLISQAYTEALAEFESQQD
jgi:multimeric flavodoxin WrbA